MTNKENHVHDLSHLEVNFKDCIGSDVLILKLSDGRYHKFTLDTKGRLCYEQSCFISPYYTPLPSHKPREWVTLTTVTGEKVKCEFVETHKFSKSGLMIFEDANEKDERVVIGVDDDIYQASHEYVSIHFTPIPPPNPALDKVAELENIFESGKPQLVSDIELFRVTIDELKQLIKEQSNG